MCFLARWQAGKTAEYAPSSNPQAREQVLCASWASGPHHGRLWVPLGPRLLTDFSLTRKRFLLFAENILCLVILICFRASTSGYSLSVIEMIFAAIFVVYMCDLHTKIQIINQPWSDFFWTLVAIILYLITSIVDCGACRESKTTPKSQRGYCPYALHNSLIMIPTLPSPSLIAQLVKNLPAMQETPLRFLGREDPLEKG